MYTPPAFASIKTRSIDYNQEEKKQLNPPDACSLGQKFSIYSSRRKIKQISTLCPSELRTRIIDCIENKKLDTLNNLIEAEIPTMQAALTITDFTECSCLSYAIRSIRPTRNDIFFAVCCLYEKYPQALETVLELRGSHTSCLNDAIIYLIDLSDRIIFLDPDELQPAFNRIINLYLQYPETLKKALAAVTPLGESCLGLFINTRIMINNKSRIFNPLLDIYADETYLPSLQAVLSSENKNRISCFFTQDKRDTRILRSILELYLKVDSKYLKNLLNSITKVYEKTDFQGIMCTITDPDLWVYYEKLATFIRIFKFFRSKKMAGLSRIPECSY